MNRKAFVLLYISGFAFLVAIFVFFGTLDKQTPGGGAVYLGEKEIKAFELYEKAEQDLYVIELTALLAGKEASQEDEETFKNSFETLFTKRLEENGFDGTGYSFTYTFTSETVTIIGKTTTELVYHDGSLTYAVVPNVKVTVPFEESEDLR